MKPTSKQSAATSPAQDVLIPVGRAHLEGELNIPLAALGNRIGAVVSRGGRPDLAGDALPNVQAPTLLLVGGDDHVVIRMNREALARLRCEAELVIAPGAAHLFEEPSALEQVARLAADWFRGHLGLYKGVRGDSGVGS